MNEPYSDEMIDSPRHIPDRNGIVSMFVFGLAIALLLVIIIAIAMAA